jgi:HEAT repeat protein
LAVVDTLGIIGSPQAVTTLVGLMNKIPDGELSLELMDAMGRVMNPDSLGLLLAVAKGEQSACVSARLAAMQALPHYGRSYVTPALSVIAQGDSNDEIKSAAKAALAVLDAKKK